MGAWTPPSQRVIEAMGEAVTIRGAFRHSAASRDVGGCSAAGPCAPHPFWSVDYVSVPLQSVGDGKQRYKMGSRRSFTSYGVGYTRTVFMLSRVPSLDRACGICTYSLYKKSLEERQVGGRPLFVQGISSDKRGCDRAEHFWINPASRPLPAAPVLPTTSKSRSPPQGAARRRWVMASPSANGRPPQTGRTVIATCAHKANPMREAVPPGWRSLSNRTTVTFLLAVRS